MRYSIALHIQIEVEANDYQSCVEKAFQTLATSGIKGITQITPRRLDTIIHEEGCPHLTTWDSICICGG